MPSAANSRSVSSLDLPSRKFWKMRFTISASSGTMTRSSPSQRYPYTRKCPFGMPFSNRFLIPHLQFSERLRLSSCAKDARMVSINSPSPLMELMCSFSNRTSTPMSFKCRTVCSKSTVFLAKRWIDFVRMMSISPLSAASIIRLNSSRLAIPVPLIPSSANTPAYCQSGFFCIREL